MSENVTPYYLLQFERWPNGPEADCMETIADLGLGLLRFAFGQTVVVTRDAYFLSEDLRGLISTIERLFAGAIFFLLAPLSIPLSAIGFIALQCSTSHSKTYENYAIYMSKPKAEQTKIGLSSLTSSNEPENPSETKEMSWEEKWKESLTSNNNDLLSSLLAEKIPAMSAEEILQIRVTANALPVLMRELKNYPDKLQEMAQKVDLSLWRNSSVTFTSLIEHCVDQEELLTLWNAIQKDHRRMFLLIRTLYRLAVDNKLERLLFYVDCLQAVEQKMDAAELPEIFSQEKNELLFLSDALYFYKLAKEKENTQCIDQIATYLKNHYLSKENVLGISKFTPAEIEALFSTVLPEEFNLYTFPDNYRQQPDQKFFALLKGLFRRKLSEIPCELLRNLLKKCYINIDKLPLPENAPSELTKIIQDIFIQDPAKGALDGKTLGLIVVFMSYYNINTQEILLNMSEQQLQQCYPLSKEYDPLYIHGSLLIEMRKIEDAEKRLHTLTHYLIHADGAYEMVNFPTKKDTWLPEQCQAIVLGDQLTGQKRTEEIIRSFTLRRSEPYHSNEYTLYQNCMQKMFEVMTEEQLTYYCSLRSDENSPLLLSWFSDIFSANIENPKKIFAMFQGLESRWIIEALSLNSKHFKQLIQVLKEQNLFFKTLQEALYFLSPPQLIEIEDLITLLSINTQEDCQSLSITQQTIFKHLLRKSYTTSDASHLSKALALFTDPSLIAEVYRILLKELNQTGLQFFSIQARGEFLKTHIFDTDASQQALELLSTTLKSAAQIELFEFFFLLHTDQLKTMDLKTLLTSSLRYDARIETILNLPKEMMEQALDCFDRSQLLEGVKVEDPSLKWLTSIFQGMTPEQRNQYFPNCSLVGNMFSGECRIMRNIEEGNSLTNT